MGREQAGPTVTAKTTHWIYRTDEDWI